MIKNNKIWRDIHKVINSNRSKNVYDQEEDENKADEYLNTGIYIKN